MGVFSSQSSQGVWGATTLRSIVTVPSKLIYSILFVDMVGLLRFLGKIPSLGSSGCGITFSLILLSFHLGKVIPRLGLLS